MLFVMIEDWKILMLYHCHTTWILQLSSSLSGNVNKVVLNHQTTVMMMDLELRSSSFGNPDSADNPMRTNKKEQGKE